jgi:hypothetical protein
MYLTITAKVDTYLKKFWQLQADDLKEHQKVFVPKGRSYAVANYKEFDLHQPMASHVEVDLAFKQGTWYIFPAHWTLPWEIPDFKTPFSSDISHTTVDWEDFNSPVSEYFTVGEVCLYQKDRIVRATSHKINVVTLAKKLDSVRKWAGCPLIVNSWYRPPHINARVGGVANSRHCTGDAADIRPTKGSIQEFQLNFEKEWYDAGKWEGGFGRGARKGFIHLDTYYKRIWNY